MDGGLAAVRAEQLLRSLGLDAVGLIGPLEDRGGTTTDQDWTASGLADLCGRADGPPLRPVGAPATLARGAGLALSALVGHEVETVSRLGQRAALLGLRRNGSTSTGGAARLVPAADGWCALNLPRDCDLDLVPALTGRSGPDPWADVMRWAAPCTTAEVVEQAALLGLAVAALPPLAQTFAAPWTLQPPGRARVTRARPRVVNLGALWAGPLCAHLLHECGIEVIDVEAAERPDVTEPAFWDVLHAGHEQRTIPFTTAAGRAELRRTLTDADVVIEASRPRALRALGVDAATMMTDGRPRVWLRITGHGPDHDRIAFGDDAAAGGGLLAWDDDGPVFVGDAIADPLTGILGALAVVASLRTGCPVVDLPMVEVARAASSPVDRCHDRRHLLDR